LNAQDVTFNAPAACNGAATTGSWTVPCGVTSITVELYGGGGGGGGGGDGSNGGVFCGDNRGGGGGGGGAYSSRTINVTPGTSFTYAVGGGGCGGAGGGEGDDGVHGTNGGNTTFVGTDATSTPINMAANGGQGGRRGESCSNVGGPSTGGTASGGTTNTPGTGGSAAQPRGTRIGGVGGAGAGPLGGAGGTASVNSSVPGTVRGGGGGGGGDSPGGRGAQGILLITYNTPIVLPTTPTTSSTPATCSAAGSTTISNYDPTMTYVFTPAGPTAGAGGAITGMTFGTSYTVIASQGSCNSAPSAAFSNSAQTAPPATPTVTTAPPTCSAAGSATITNYNAAYTYTFAPAGPTAGAGGVISNMTVGTSYTVDASDGSCNAPAPSTAFSIAAQLPAVATPTVASTPPTCTAGGSSTISNYNAALGYTFNPAGPSVGAGGAINGMNIGTSYIVLANDGTCTSSASASFSNAPQTSAPAVPTVTTTPPSCSAAGSATITNYNAALTYIFLPAGPSAGAGGVITGMTPGTSYNVGSSDGTCTSPAPSNSFSIAAQLPTPATPTVTSTPPTCSADGSSTISNYNAALTYTFTPAGPSANAGGAITGMTIGTSYTVVANDGSCNSTPSAAFSNAPQTTAPAVPTVTTTPPSCSAAGSSTISNYNAALTYTFSPTGPTAGAGGAITGMTPGTSYTVESSDGTCNSITPSNPFSNGAQFPTPVAAIAGSLSYCTGGNTTLTASGGTGYAWTDANSNNVGNTASVTITQGSYTVLVTDANGCTALANATVTEATSLTVTISGTLTYCPGGNTTLTANGGTNFVWNDANNSTTAAITVTAGTYSVTTSDASGCTGTNTATVTEFTAPVASISGALSYCVGGNTTLTASGGASYVWNDASNSTTAAITVTQGSYTVTATDANTCTATATANVTEDGPPTITISGALSYCTGGNTTITASGGNDYLWSNGETTASTTVTQGTYTVTVTNATGCTNTESVTITENAGVTADFSFVSTCAGEEVLFQNLSVGATDYSWSFGNGATSTDISPTVIYNNGGTFTVTLTATAGNCSDDTTQTIVVSDKPVANFTANQLNLIQNETGLEIINNSTGATAWYWTFGDSTVSSEFEPIHYYAQKGVYDVSLIATSAGGCSDTITKLAWVKVVEKPSLYIPNLFSPNDDGVNDFFKIEGGGFKQVDLKIFNRWGEKVFETDNANIGWDGYAGGEKAQPGIYVYHLTILYEVLNTTQHTGSIILVR